jgi:Na+-translocating ferredoxin:NAD+ oxidoreductase RnfG subunit
MKLNIKFLTTSAIILGALTTPKTTLYAKTYLSIEQAKKILWHNKSMKETEIILTKDQMKSIKKSSNVRVNNNKIKALKSSDNNWLIIDQVIGKHENIDIAVATNSFGLITGVEILQYRETYGSEIRAKKWLVQFLGKSSKENLKLDKQIKNISGATLSCRHVTDGITRLTHTWEQVLKHL